MWYNNFVVVLCRKVNYMGSDVSIKEQRKRYMQQENDKFTKECIELLNKIEKLKGQGRTDEGNSLIEEFKTKLEHRIQEIESELISTPKSVVDITVFPSKGKLFAENKKLKLIVLSEKEEEDYFPFIQEYSKKNYKSIWKSFFSENSFVCSIYDKASGQFIGYCSIKDLNQEIWELAIEEKKEWHHKGYGTSALDLFMTTVTKITGNRFYKTRVDIDNYPSQALMKKLGATPNGISEYMLHGEALENFRRENMHLIDDKIRSIAEEFCMDAEDIVGYVLEYIFDKGEK